MTLYLYTGTPGSGKSLHMAKRLYWDVRMHRPCVANFGINTSLFKNGAESFTELDNTELTPKRLVRISETVFRTQEFREGTIRLYIDEAQVIFSNRDWRAEDRAEWVRFFTQHRKFGYEIVIVAQCDQMIDKQIRSLVEYEVLHRKLNNSGWVGRLSALFLAGHPAVCAVTRWYGMRMRLGAEWMLGTKKYYSLYDTRKMFTK